MKITNENELLDLLINYNESKKYDEGLILIKENEDIIKKKYYEITKLKLEFYIQKNMLIDAKILINSELNVPYIPKEFESFIKEKEKEVNFLLNEKKGNHISDEMLENLDKLSDDGLIVLLPHLSNYNLNKYIVQLQNLLNSDNISYINKSLLIACMCDCKINHTFNISKYDDSMSFNPTTIIDLRNTTSFINMNKIVDSFIDIEINSVELIKQLLIYALLDYYPFNYDDEKLDLLIAAAIQLCQEMNNSEIIIKKYELISIKNDSLIQKYKKLLNNLIKVV